MRNKILEILSFLILTSLLITACSPNNVPVTDNIVDEVPQDTAVVTQLPPTETREPTPTSTPEVPKDIDLSQIGGIHFQRQSTTSVEGCPDTQLLIGDWVVVSMGPTGQEDVGSGNRSLYLWVRDLPNSNSGSTKIGAVQTVTALKIIEGPECYKGTVYWKVEPGEGELGWGWETENNQQTGWVAGANYEHHWFTPIALLDQIVEMYPDNFDLFMYFWFIISATDMDMRYYDDLQLYDYYTQVGDDLFIEYISMLPVYVEGFPDNPPITFGELTQEVFKDPSKMILSYKFMEKPSEMSRALLLMTLNGTDGEYLYYEFFGME